MKTLELSSVFFLADRIVVWYNWNSFGGENSLTTTDQIKMVMIRAGLNQKTLAERLGITQPTLSSKFKLNDWRESDLRKIAEICGCSYEGHFKFNNGDIV